MSKTSEEIVAETFVVSVHKLFFGDFIISVFVDSHEEIVYELHVASGWMVPIFLGNELVEVLKL